MTAHGAHAGGADSDPDRHTPGNEFATPSHDGERLQAPQRLDEWRLERVALDSPGPLERMSDVPPALISILAAMVGDVIEYERKEVATDGT